MRLRDLTLAHAAVLAEMQASAQWRESLEICRCLPLGLARTTRLLEDLALLGAVKKRPRKRGKGRVEYSSSVPSTGGA